MLCPRGGRRNGVFHFARAPLAIEAAWLGVRSVRYEAGATVRGGRRTIFRPDHAEPTPCSVRGGVGEARCPTSHVPFDLTMLSRHHALSAGG